MGAAQSDSIFGTHFVFSASHRLSIMDPLPTLWSWLVGGNSFNQAFSQHGLPRLG